MFVAGNLEGAKNHIEMVDRMYGKVKSYQKKKNDAKFDEFFAPVEENIKEWKDAVKNKNMDKAKTNFDKFMQGFGKPYSQTL